MRAGGVFAIACSLLLMAAGLHASERPGASPAAAEREVPVVNPAGSRGEVPVSPGTGSAEPSPCTAASMRMPVNVRVDSGIMPRVRQMLRRSPTFRAQCAQLAAASWVHVAVRLNPMLQDRHGVRAVTAIQRPQPQLIVAIVSLQALADPANWLSHEFEHLIEQIEAIDLERLAAARTEVWASGTGMYETLRAIRAGEAVLDEVRSHDQHANFVEE